MSLHIPNKSPVVIDVLGPDWSTSILPDGVKMVLHVNPTTMSFSYARQVERIQTWGGWVEQHWGDAISTIDFSASTGGFMRLYSGLSHTTNPAYGGTRRETIAYDTYLDLLSLFKQNGSVYDSNGHIVLQGILKVTFEEGIYLGWFTNMSVSQTAEQPYQFSFTASFTVEREETRWRSVLAPSGQTVGLSSPTDFYQSELV